MVCGFLNPPQKEHFCPLNTSSPHKSSGVNGRDVICLHYQVQWGYTK